MGQFFADLLRQLHPSGERLQIMNRFQRRALVPTWPVTVTLAILGGALLLAGQGQAIVRFTSSEFGFDWNSVGTWFFLTLHSVIMMYTAFVLSAVTRRSYLDTSETKAAIGMSDPVDPSIKLRLVYSYLCGVFLPLLLMAMALWFRHGGGDWRVWTGLVIGLVAAGVYLKIAQITYPAVSRNLGRLYARSPEDRSWADGISRPLLRVIRFATQPSHRIAQSAIVILIFMMISLSAFFPITGGDAKRLSTGLLMGAWAFFLSFLFIHTFFRLFTERFVKLHHGHTARYIIIDRNLSIWFGWLRFALILFIPALFWWYDFVVWLGPLNVGLFGTLWVTLVLSYFVETGALRWRIPASNQPREDKKAQDRHVPDITFRSYFFLFLLLLLAIETLLGLAELIRYRYQGNLILAVIALVVIVGLVSVAIQLGRRVFKNQTDFVTRLNSIPTLMLLSPILLLGLGEAHHVHRIDLDAEAAAQHASLATGAAADEAARARLASNQVLSLKEHAELWLSERAAAAEGENAVDAEPIPAIVILAEGGGIRAAAHAGYYLSALDEAVREHCKTASKAAESQAGSGVDRLCWRKEETRLIDNVYLVSGVSGGAIGTATYLAALYEENEADPAKLRDDCGWAEGQKPCLRDRLIGDTLSADHLSSLLSGMFASDVLTTIVPVQLPNRVVALFDGKPDTPEGEMPEYNTEYVQNFEKMRGMPDRADIFETRLARVFENARLGALRDKTDDYKSDDAGRTFDLSLEHVARRASQTGLEGKGPGPIVFFSTFSETLGIQMATANVDIVKEGQGAGDAGDNDGGRDTEAEVCGAVPIVQQIIRQTERLPPDPSFHCSGRTRTLPLSTAAHMSARFPISNPTGVIETRDQLGRWRRHFFVDGGYMDNSGAFAASQAVEALIQAAKDEENGEEVNVIVLHLYALSVPPQKSISAKTSAGSVANRQAEFSSIPSALMKARAAASRAPVMLLCDQIFKFEGARDGVCDEVLAIRIPDPKPYGLVDGKGGSESAFETRFHLKDFNSWYNPEDASIVEAYGGCPTDGARFKAIADAVVVVEKEEVTEPAADPMPEQDTLPDDVPAEETSVAEEPETPAPRGLVAASWMPMPLEVATNSRQDNAMAALLGWTLPEQMDATIRWVAKGAGELTADELIEVTGSQTARQSPNAAGRRCPVEGAAQ